MRSPHKKQLDSVKRYLKRRMLWKNWSGCCFCGFDSTHGNVDVHELESTKPGGVHYKAMLKQHFNEYGHELYSSECTAIIEEDKADRELLISRLKDADFQPGYPGGYDALMCDIEIKEKSLKTQS